MQFCVGIMLNKYDTVKKEMPSLIWSTSHIWAEGFLLPRVPFARGFFVSNFKSRE